MLSELMMTALLAQVYAYTAPHVQLGPQVRHLPPTVHGDPAASSAWLHYEPLACKDNASEAMNYLLPGFSGHSGYVDRRLRALTDSHCFVEAAVPCFRAAYDLTAHADISIALNESVHQLGSRSSTSSSDPMTRVTEFVAHLFEQRLGVRRLAVQMVVKTRTDVNDSFNGQPFHADLASNQRYWYTALVFFTTQGVDFGDGGATLFVDAASRAGSRRTDEAPAAEQAQESREHSLEVHEGFAAAPRFGLALLFSGGLENLHGRLPMSGWGARGVVQIWYRCAATAGDEGEHEAFGPEVVAVPKAADNRVQRESLAVPPPSPSKEEL